MNKQNKLEYFRSKGMLPFQAEVAIKFLESSDKPFWQIVSAVGTGKTHLASVITGELMQEPKQRTLVLAPAALLAQWHFELSRTVPNATSTIVDRRTYLEMESHAGVGCDPWPDNAIIIMSIDLAKREDMAEKLSSVTWDFIVFDESHLLTGKRESLFERLMASRAIRRCLLLTCYKPLKLHGVETVVVHKSELVNWDQKPLFSHHARTVTQLAYTRTEEEVIFLNQLHDFTNELSSQSSYGRLQSTLIRQVGLSSTFATDTVLLRLLDAWTPIRNKIAHNLPVVGEDVEEIEKQSRAFCEEAEVTAKFSGSAPFRPQEFMILYQTVLTLLDQVEDISTDSKFDALAKYLRAQLEFEPERNPHYCICSSFANTVQYLSSSLSTPNLQIDIYALTGSLNPSYRQDAIERFREKGGLLIATDPALEGTSLSYVSECINYDLPVNPDVFEQRWGRFIRFDRKTDFRMAVLVDNSQLVPWDNDIFKLIKEK